MYFISDTISGGQPFLAGADLFNLVVFHFYILLSL